MKRSQTRGSAAGAARHSGIPNLITCFICHNLFLNQSGLWRKPSSRGRIHTSSSRRSGSSDAAVLPRSHSRTSGSFGTFFGGVPDRNGSAGSHPDDGLMILVGPDAALTWAGLLRSPGLLFLHPWAPFSSNPADCTTSVPRKLQEEAK